MTLARVSQLAFSDDGPYRVREEGDTQRNCGCDLAKLDPSSSDRGEDRVKFGDPGQQKGFQGLTLLAWQPGAK